MGRLFRKKFSVLKKLPDEIYPIYTDVYDFWVQSLKFVEEYIEIFYNKDDKDDSELLADGELSRFYDEIRENLGIDKKYRLKKFNIINILTHFICNATIWNHHTSSSVSFEYSIDPDFTGLKIVGNNAKQTNISGYVEYCLLALSKGWQFSNMQLPANDSRIIVLNGTKTSEENITKAIKIFDTYFGKALDFLKKNIEDRNQIRIAPYNGCNPQYLQSSFSL